MNIKHFTLIVTLVSSLLVPTSLYAQDAARNPASQQPAKSNENISTLAGSAAAYRSRGSLTQAFSSAAIESDEPCAYCRGWLVEAFLRWTDRLVTKLDPTGLVDTPFEPATGDAAGSGGIRQPPAWRPVPRFRPVQLHGGYGLVARITF